MTSEERAVQLLIAVRRYLAIGVGVIMLGMLSNVLIYINIDNNDGSIDDTKTQVDEIGEYVDDLQEVTPDERARNDAITKAVQDVPRLRAILCDPAAFPEAAGCQNDS